MLEFQVAGAAGGYLLEHLLIESIGAIRGGGIFAWANAGGAKILLEDDTFEEFLKAGDFKLFVGTDTITDTSAVQKLTELSTKHSRLTVRAFLSPTASLFHPKLTWFEHDDHVSLIVGSGNLTMGGLRSNWEAFVVERLTGRAAQDAVAKIEGFLTAQGEHLAPATDPRVLARVKKNTGNERTLRASGPAPSAPGDLAHSVEEVLITDFPVTRARPAQANFKLKDYKEFFGAKEGTQRRIALRLVDQNGSVGDIQSRPNVSRKSRNFSFELDGLKAAIESGSGRPIGLFLRITTGEFLYAAVQPGQPGFSQLDALLAARSTERANQMRRIRIAVSELSAAWPTAPVLKIALPAL